MAKIAGGTAAFGEFRHGVLRVHHSCETGGGRGHGRSLHLYRDGLAGSQIARILCRVATTAAHIEAHLDGTLRAGIPGISHDGMISDHARRRRIVGCYRGLTGKVHAEIGLACNERALVSGTVVRFVQFHHAAIGQWHIASDNEGVIPHRRWCVRYGEPRRTKGLDVPHGMYKAAIEVPIAVNIHRAIERSCGHGTEVP